MPGTLHAGFSARSGAINAPCIKIKSERGAGAGAIRRLGICRSYRQSRAALPGSARGVPWPPRSNDENGCWSIPYGYARRLLADSRWGVQKTGCGIFELC